MTTAKSGRADDGVLQDKEIRVFGSSLDRNRMIRVVISIIANITSEETGWEEGIYIYIYIYINWGGANRQADGRLARCLQQQTMAGRY